MDRIINTLKGPILDIIQGEGSMIDIIYIVLYGLIFLSCGLFVYTLGKYLRDYRILEQIGAKISGDVLAYDRVKRSQMRTQLEQNQNAFSRKEKKVSLINEIYLLISHTSILEHIPGFSEAGLILVIGLLTVVLFIGISILRGPLIAIIVSFAFLMICWYILSLMAYSRKVKLEKQLLQFTNACASASLQYADIIDIFGAVYDQFSSPLREGLEACYVEAKATSDKKLALKHLKDRYDSTQFSFIIDNLEVCSSVTGDYHGVAQDISDMISVYSRSHEKKRVSLRNAKVNIVTMFVIAGGIIFALDKFMGNIMTFMMTSTIGNILAIALVLIFFYGINLKTEK